MKQTIRAIYEHGVLRPLTPLMLPDRTEVQITVESASEPSAAEMHRRQLDAALLAAGLLAPRTGADPTHPPLTEAQRDALAHNIPAGRPLSALILEERDERYWPTSTPTAACSSNAMSARSAPVGYAVVQHLRRAT